MKGKLAFLTGAALGYVLGSRAGRERYEQIKRFAKKVWNSDPVQKGANAVRDLADDRGEDLKQAAQRAGSQVLGKISEQMASASAKPVKRKSDAHQDEA